MSNSPHSFQVLGWSSQIGDIHTRAECEQWLKGKRVPSSSFSKVTLESVPSRISRRLGTLGKSVLAATEKCMPFITEEPEVICVSRHGDLPTMEKLIQCTRTQEDISPTTFTYSVHNRFSSCISMFANYRGVNAAYSSVHDGFPIALCEAVSLLKRTPKKPILLIAYEPEIPEAYLSKIDIPWQPHVGAFVLGSAQFDTASYSISQVENNDESLDYAGSCLPFIRCLVEGADVNTGRWTYSKHG